MKQKALFIICLLFGLMFINAGLNKFLNYMPVPENLPAKMIQMGTAFKEIHWLFPLIGIVEITGGLLFIIPKFRPLGAIMILPVMVGIILTHITAAPSGLPMAIILLAVDLGVIYNNREKFLALINH